MPIVAGISDHIGWAEVVTLSLRDQAPVILDRRRVELIAPGLPSAPYHHEGLVLPLAEAESVVLKTRESVTERCRSALADLRSSLHVEAVVIQQSPYERLPDSVARVLASWQLTCAADGMMYREELASQAAAIGLVVHRTPRTTKPIAAASQALRLSESEVAALLEGFGKAVGSPWRKEHKLVAAAALCILAGSTVFRDRRP